VQDLADVYARSLFEVGKETGSLDDLHEQVGQFADELAENREMQMFFFSPYFSSTEKKDGIDKVVDGGDENFLRFLELLAERHRMPVLFRIRRAFDQLWAEEQNLLNVEITSAVELDRETVDGIGRKIEEQTGRNIELSSHVDPEVLGGLVLRVGNQILDASIRSRLDRLRKQVAQAT
jgi:F-type H+-transporting ATPase subunit delta